MFAEKNLHRIFERDLKIVCAFYRNTFWHFRSSFRSCVYFLPLLHFFGYEVCPLDEASRNIIWPANRLR